MKLLAHHRSRAVAGAIATVAATAATTFLATPAVAADDPAAGISCNITQDWATSQLGVYCFDDVALAPVTFVDYQWERDGAAIPGATQSTYKYQQSDMGHLYSATVGLSRGGAKVTVSLGRASATDRTALFLINGCDVSVSNRFNRPAGVNRLDSVDLNDTITLKAWPEAASNLTVSGPYWTMTTTSGPAVLPAQMAGQAQGWTVRLSDLASIDAILGPNLFLGPKHTDPVRRGWVEVHNSFTVTGGDVSATVDTCPWGPDAPSGYLSDSLFQGGGPARNRVGPDFPIADHAAGDTGVQGVLTACRDGWNPQGTNTATFTYQWTRDGQFIAGATSDSYTLTAEDSGKKIGLVMWGTVGEGPKTTMWIWGEVTAGEIKAPAPAATASAAASGSTAAPASAAPRAAASGAKAKASPATLAATGSTTLPVVGLAVVLLAAGAVAVVVRRRADQLG